MFFVRNASAARVRLNRQLCFLSLGVQSDFHLLSPNVRISRVAKRGDDLYCNNNARIRLSDGDRRAAVLQWQQDAHANSAVCIRAYE